MDILLDLLNLRPRPDWKWTLDPRVRTWDAGNALAMANISALVYSDPPAISESLKDTRRGFQSVQCYSDPTQGTGTECLLAARSDVIVMAFRGTEPTRWRDYRTDFSAGQEVYAQVFGHTGWGQVHKGWVAAVRSVREPMLAELDRLIVETAEPRPLWLTGHSMGGALAMLAASVLRNVRPHVPIAGVYTFGQPRVGDGAFRDQYEAELGAVSFRCVNDGDPIVYVPPAEFSVREAAFFSGWFSPKRWRNLFSQEPPYRYAHAGQLRLLLREGGISSDPADEQARELRFLALGAEERGSLASLVSDLPAALARFPQLLLNHLPIRPRPDGLWEDGYIDRIEALMSVQDAHAA